MRRLRGSKAFVVERGPIGFDEVEGSGRQLQYRPVRVVSHHSQLEDIAKERGGSLDIRRMHTNETDSQHLHDEPRSIWPDDYGPITLATAVASRLGFRILRTVVAMAC